MAVGPGDFDLCCITPACKGEVPYEGHPSRSSDTSIKQCMILCLLFELVCFYMVACLMIVIFLNVSQMVRFSFSPLPKLIIKRGDLVVSRFKGAGSLMGGNNE